MKEMTKIDKDHHHHHHHSEFGFSRPPSWWEQWNGWMVQSKLGKIFVPPPFSIEDNLQTKQRRIEACLQQAATATKTITKATKAISTTTDTNTMNNSIASGMDLWELRDLALSKGGLLTPELRKKAWPLLVGVSQNTSIISKRSQEKSIAAAEKGALGDNLEKDNTTRKKATSTSTSTSTNSSSLPNTSRPPLHSTSTTALSDSTNTSHSTSDTVVKTPEKIVPLTSSSSSSSSSSTVSASASTSASTTTSHDASLDLIRRDVGRSVVFRYYDPSKDENGVTSGAPPPYVTEHLAKALEQTIRTSTFHSSPSTSTSTSTPTTNNGMVTENVPPLSSTSNGQAHYYHYYQGLHDVAGAILHQLDYNVETGTRILQRLAHSHWRDALRENFGHLTWIIHHLSLPLIACVDGDIHDQLEWIQVEMSNLILPWMITWFTHDIFDADIAGRLIDALMVSHPLFSFYMSIALITHPNVRHVTLEADPNDPASLFVALKQLPKCIVLDPTAGTTTTTTTTDSVEHAVIPAQDLIDSALALLHNYPPRSLLHLVDTDILPPLQVVQHAQAMGMFQAVRTWTISSPCMRSPLGMTSTSSFIWWLSLHPAFFFLFSSSSSSPSLSSSSCLYTRAKIASGVPLLMNTVGPQWQLHRPPPTPTPPFLSQSTSRTNNGWFNMKLLLRGGRRRRRQQQQEQEQPQRRQ